jgi:hypothetical protein
MHSGLINWFKNFGKNRMAKRYARRLPRRLAKDCGSSEFYTKGQIDTAIKNLGLESKFDAIAYGGFLPKEEFEEWVHEMPVPMSHEVAWATFLRYLPFNLDTQNFEPVANSRTSLRGGRW